MKYDPCYTVYMEFCMHMHSTCSFDKELGGKKFLLMCKGQEMKETECGQIVQGIVSKVEFYGTFYSELAPSI